ncbi:FadR/GntR family transcriptional regulator [Dactylosporangium maewongense]|uniref:FadR/GntR family transcriptional regulator n=1 Tax=Dactylosporangium maewongense TaxID=634393 RepID=A0ABN2A4C2_9ACTN
MNRDRPQKTAMLVAQRIVNEISRQNKQVGDRLSPERVMLEEYQVGRGTLRESLRFLELQGVISLKPGPGGGPIVEKPDASHLATSLILLLQFEQAPFRSILETRAALEPLMARLASQRIDAERLRQLEESVQKMGEHIADQGVFLETNKSFHDVIAWASGNTVFGFLVDALLDILDGTVLGVDYPEHRRGTVLKRHRSIYDAIAASDGDVAEESMREHIAEMTRYLEKKFASTMDASITWSVVR